MFDSLGVAGTAFARFTRVLAFGFLSPLIASCTSYEVEDHSFQFNQAIGSLGNRLLLLNAVRAAKGYPMQFSKLSSYTGKGRADASLTADIPFIVDSKVGSGPLAATRLIGTAKPNVSVRTGVELLQLADLNIAEAQTALRKQATAREFEYYVLQGWPLPLVLTVMIQSLEVDERLVHAFFQRYREFCDAKPDDPKCWLRDELIACRGTDPRSPEGIDRHERHGVTHVAFDNNPRSRCSFVMFQWFREAFRIAEGTYDIPFKKKKDKEKDAKKQSAKYRSDKFAIDVNVKLPDKEMPETPPQPSVDLFFQIASIEALYRRLLKETEKRGERIGVIEINWRSPERMVRFLGDVIAAQELAHEPWVVMTRIGDHPVELFRVKRGKDLGGGTAVTVVDPEGERFFIPIPDHGSPTKHISLQTLALVMEFLNSAVSGKSLPQPTTVLLSGG